MALTPAPAKLRRELTKLWLSYRWMLIIGIIGLMVVVGGYFGYSASQENARRSQLQQSDALAQKVGQDLSRTIGQQIKLLDGLDYTVLAQLLSGEQSQSAQDAITAIVTAHKSILGLRLLSNPVQDTDDQGMPPITYAAIGMARKAAQTGKIPPMEVLLARTKQYHIAALRPLKDNSGSIIGHALFALDPGILKRAFAAEQVSDGYLELNQRGGKKPQPIAYKGERGSRQGRAAVTKKIKGTVLQVQYWPQSANAEASEGETDLTLWYLLVVVLVVLAAGAFMFLRKKKRGPDGLSDTAANEAALSSKLKALKTGGGAVQEQSPVENDGPLTPAEQVEPVAGPEIDESIFRAYDIRGVVNRNLGADVVRKIGLAIGSEAYDRGQQTLVVGCDGRLSSPELLEALMAGLRESGRDVIEIGRVPTPVLYFATHYLETGSGVVITGSHNPPDYNGLKIMLGGETLFGEAIQALKQRVIDAQFSSGSGTHQSMEISTDYIRRISDDVPVALGNAFKVVIDCGNGIAGEFAPKLIRALGHDVVELFCDVDGNFPNHHPDPSDPENLVDLIRVVKEQDADLGFAFDGDGDRLGVVDSNGVILWPDLQMMLYAKDVLSRNPGAEIVFDVKCTSRLAKVISKLGGKPVMYKTGHSFIKNKLRETGAPLAGEMSGHIFFSERWYGFDDAMYTAARLLEILMNFKQRPADVFAKLPRGVSTPELKLEVAEGENEALIAQLVGNNPFADAQVSTIDGLRIDWPDGWGLARASNTTPSIVLRFEGDSEEALERIKSSFREALLNLNPELKLPF